MNDLNFTTTESTCAEMCWYAREEKCRCSCGGRNHGILLHEGAERPARQKRVKGRRFQLMHVVNGWTEAHDLAKQLQTEEMQARAKTLLAGLGQASDISQPSVSREVQNQIRHLQLRESVVGGFEWSAAGDHVVQRASGSALKWQEVAGCAFENPHLIWKML